MHLSVQDDIKDHHPLRFNQIIDAVVVGQDAADVTRDGLKFGLARIARSGIPAERPDFGQHFILGFFGPDERGALKVLDDALHGGNRPVCDDDISVHGRKIAMREQRRSKIRTDMDLASQSPPYFWCMENAALALATTPLHQVHLDAGARMVPFAGYEMPVQYSGLRAEHEAVRTAAGLFDVSHMGELWFSGAGAAGYLQFLLAGDIAKAAPGRALYTCLLNEDGGIVEDLLVYGFEDRYLVVVNAANRAEVVSIIGSTLPADVQFEDASDRTALLALQGPNADLVMQAMGVDLSGLKYYHHTQVQLQGVEVVVGATGYTGERGFELYVPNAAAPGLWQALMEAGDAHGLVPCGLGARDTLRLEKGFCLHGNDIGPSRNPVEAGLSWVVGWKTEFRGKDAVVGVKERGPERKLVGFTLNERGIPRKDYPIVDENGQTIGVVTSGTQSPSLGVAIGLGYVPMDVASKGSEVFISIRGKSIRATVTGIPFL